MSVKIAGSDANLYTNLGVYSTIRFAIMNMYSIIKHTLRPYKKKIVAVLRGTGMSMPSGDGLQSPVSYRFSEHDAQIVAAIVRSGKLHHDQGSEMALFEREFARFIGVPHAIATNSGTSALALAVQALGLKPGDEVIVPAYAFVAAAQAVLSHNAIPVFADIDATCTVSPKSILRSISKRTKAIIVVHIFGNVAAMDKIKQIAKRYDLRIIEDCAQAVGASYHGQQVGSLDDIGCFSFNIKKALPTGQGGMVTTSSDIYDQRIRAARNTGLTYVNGQADALAFGGTYFMTEMEAALGRSVLRQLAYLNGVRKKNYEYLMQLLTELQPYLRPYDELPESQGSYSRLSFILNTRLLTVTRDQFINTVQQMGLPLKKFYPTPLYRYSLFKNKQDAYTRVSFPFSLSKKRGEYFLPYAEKFNKEHVGMEFSPYWDFSDMRKIAASLTKAVRGSLK